MDESPLDLTRRAVLAAVPAFALGAALPAWAAEDSGITAGSLGTFIGKNLASSAVGKVGGLALGEVLQRVGFQDADSQEVLNKLNAILSRLDDIADQIDKLGIKLEKQLAALSYDVASQPVLRLIDRNGSLADNYRALLDARDPGAIESVKGRIKQLNDALLIDGPRTWHNALTGGSNQTGLIASINRQALTSSDGLYGTKAAEQMQAQWEYLDTQQALTIAWLVNYQNATGGAESVPETLRQFAQRRQQQVAMLRGMKDRDVELLRDTGAGLTPVRVPLSYLPDGTAIQAGAGLMWSLELSPTTSHEFRERLSQALTERTGLGAFRIGGTPDYWRVCHTDEFGSIVKQCGGELGGDRDYFAAKLIDHGFRFPGDGPAHVWATRNNFFVVYKDGGSWDDNPWGDKASYLWVRSLAPGEQSRYFF